MSNPFELRITLRQHTPIIHFQHHQDGATLRASEVKPKLDRFLIRKVTEEICKTKGWFVGNGEHPALDYKISFTSTDSWEHPAELPKLRKGELDFDNRTGNLRMEQIPSYFGNMGEENLKEPKKLVFSRTDIECKIFCFHTELIDILKQKLNEFFFWHNFGTRQSKGFGSFSLTSINGLPIQGLAFPYAFEVSTTGDNNFSTRFKKSNIDKLTQANLTAHWQLFRSIDLFHKAIKSGYNVNDNYVKSALFLFFEDKKIQWDKRSIKQEYVDRTITNLFNSKSDNGHFFLVRDLLGLAVESEWKQTAGSPKITKENSEIDRYKSPIIYKPIRINEGTFKVYVGFTNLDDNFLNKTFTIKKNGNGNLKLDTPKSFSFREYFKFLGNIDIDEWINIDNRSNADVKTMKKIFKSFQNLSKF
jgi:hypothetical protein